MFSLFSLSGYAATSCITLMKNIKIFHVTRYKLVRNKTNFLLVGTCGAVLIICFGAIS